MKYNLYYGDVQETFFRLHTALTPAEVTKPVRLLRSLYVFIGQCGSFTRRNISTYEFLLICISER